MSPIKVIVFKGKDAVEKFYFSFDPATYELITTFESALRTRIMQKDFSLSWIDSDDDEISIKDDDDFEFFCRAVRAANFGVSPTSVKLYVRIENIVPAVPEPQQQQQQQQQEKRVSFSIATDTKASEQPLFEHNSVVCDGCEGDVRGFRYKCLQCADYDLCMSCESKMIHKDHLMVRIPGNPAAMLPCKLDRVLNLGKYFTVPREEAAKKTCKEPKDWRKEERGWRKEEDKMRKVEEKMRRFEEKLCRRDEKQDRRRGHHRGTTPRECRSAETTPTASNPNPHGFFYQALDFLNFMMNPDNIMASHFTPPPTAPQAPEPTPAPTPPSTDKAQEAQEKAKPTDKATEAQEKIKPTATDKAQEAQEKSEETPRSFLKPTIATAVALGTDANSMTTSVGVPAAEETDTTKCLVPEKKDEEPTAAEKSIAQQINEKLAAMERAIERSRSPTISIASSDSDLSKDGDRDWTVIDDEEEDMGAVGGQQEKQDKATSTDSEASFVPNQSGNTTPAPRPSQPRDVPMSFEQLGRELKAHIEAQAIPKTTYPHPKPPAPTPVAPVAPVPHHPLPHIHHAVETMIGMGFSNEGGWLSNLLSSVDGNIPKALDLLQPHK